MSWSLRYIGHPEKISEKLDEMLDKLAGESKAEFADALPGLKTLLAQNFQKQEGVLPPIMQLVANGHGYHKDGNRVYCQCSVSLSSLDGQLV